jgi:hypothetical protein
MVYFALALKATLRYSQEFVELVQKALFGMETCVEILPYADLDTFTMKRKNNACLRESFVV